MYSEVTEVYLGEDAEVNFAASKTSKPTYIPPKQAMRRAERLSHELDYRPYRWWGYALQMESVMNGPGATAEDVEIVFGSEASRVTQLLILRIDPRTRPDMC